MYFSVYCGIWVGSETSAMTVIRAARRKLKRPIKTRKHRAERHNFYRIVLAELNRHRKLNIALTSGSISVDEGRVQRQAGGAAAEAPKISTPELAKTSAPAMSM